MNKKIIGLLLSIVLIFSLSACTNTKSDKSEQSQDTQSDENEQPQNTQSEQNSSVSAKTAVIYFSATGTTAEVADMIAAETGADIFEIVPESEYTSDDLNYNDDNCRANTEMNDASARPAISNDLSAASEYDVVYLGYPIWWGTAPRIIQTFLESYDLSEATVYTFCTSGSSGVEQSVKDLQDLYSEINIVSGKRLNGATSSDIQDWISNLK